MKRLLIYAAVMIGVLLVPLERTDVADLHPVETVALYKTSSGYRIETDTKDYGEGETVDAAFADLLSTSSGVIYLDTAHYFLVSYGAEPAAEAMREYLKRGVRICAVIGQGDLSRVSEFLSVQPRLQLFRKWKTGDRLQILDCSEERIKFLQKNEKSA